VHRSRKPPRDAAWTRAASRHHFRTTSSTLDVGFMPGATCGLTGSSSDGDTTVAPPPFARSPAPMYASAASSASFCRLRSRSCGARDSKCDHLNLDERLLVDISGTGRVA